MFAAGCAVCLSATSGSAACAGARYDQFDFRLGEWSDVASSERYIVRRIADGCAVEEVQFSPSDGRTIIGLGVAGWDRTRGHCRELWVDAVGQVKLYVGEPGPDGTFVLTTDPTPEGERWHYVYRNITSSAIDADYSVQSMKDDGDAKSGRAVSPTSTRNPSRPNCRSAHKRFCHARCVQVLHD